GGRPSRPPRPTRRAARLRPPGPFLPRRRRTGDRANRPWAARLPASAAGAAGPPGGPAAAAASRARAPRRRLPATPAPPPRPAAAFGSLFRPWGLAANGVIPEADGKGGG